MVPREVCAVRSGKSNRYRKVTLNAQKSAEAIVCDLKVVTLIAEMLLLLSRSIPIDKCLPYTTEKAAHKEIVRNTKGM